MSRFIQVFFPAIFLLLFAAYPVCAQTNTDEQLAMMFFQDRDYEKAASLYEKLYESKPSYFYYTYLIFCYLETGDAKQAEKLVKKQMKLEPGSVKYNVDLGYVYKRLGDDGKAQRQFEDIIKNLPAERGQISEIANAFLSRRETELALKTYQKGRQLLNNSYPFNYEIANIYQISGDIANMVEEYLNFIDYDITKLQFVQDRLQDVVSNDPDGSKNEIFRKALLRRIQKSPDRTYYSEMLIWYSVQQKDFEMALNQAKSLDRRLNENGQRIYNLAKLCVTNGNYDIAEEAYRYVIAKGKDNPNALNARIELLNVSFLKLTKNYAHYGKELLDLEKEYETTLAELGKSNGTVTLISNLAHLEAFYLGNTEKAITLLSEAIDIPGINANQKAECKLELGDIYLFSGEVWEATLLYSQVDKAFKNDPLGHEAKFRNAKLSFYIGEFNWAKAQLDVLRAATSKLICNDAMELSLTISDNLAQDTTGAALSVYARAGLLKYQNKDNLALQTLDSIELLKVPHTLFDEVLFTKAEIAVKQSNFVLADSLYAKIYQTYPTEILADNAMFKQAELNENQLNNKAKAMELYQEFLTKYPGSLFSVDARKRFRALRGDAL